MNKKTVAAFIAYAASIPLANWMIDHIGTQSFFGGPHTIPVGFGYDAPSGTLMIGIALFTRDLIQRTAGTKTAFFAIGIGTLLSFIVASPALATASVVAFALGELADLIVYTPLQKKRLVLAVIASGFIGGIIDSLIFLQIAFGSTQYWQGQIIAKTAVSLVAGAFIYAGKKKLNELPIG
jgi:uncharacterized PurR-regulated membrane protein YhhQ (DUF165 family)